MTTTNPATIGFFGSGNIGGAVARLAVAAGLNVVLSNSRGPETLADLVAELGPQARAATPEEAATAGDPGDGVGMAAGEKVIGPGGWVTPDAETVGMLPNTRDPFVAWGQREAILKDAEHPAAAKLFLNRPAVQGAPDQRSVVRTHRRRPARRTEEGLAVPERRPRRLPRLHAGPGRRRTTAPADHGVHRRGPGPADPRPPGHPPRPLTPAPSNGSRRAAHRRTPCPQAPHAPAAPRAAACGAVLSALTRADGFLRPVRATPPDMTAHMCEWRKSCRTCSHLMCDRRGGGTAVAAACSRRRPGPGPSRRPSWHSS